MSVWDKYNCDGQMDIFDFIVAEEKILGVVPKNVNQRNQLQKAQKKGFDVGKFVSIYGEPICIIERFFFGTHEHREDVLHCWVSYHSGCHSWPVFGKGIELTEVPSIGVLFDYLRYGPHTVVPEVRERCKRYLDTVHGKIPQNFIDFYGDPKRWNTMPCANCEYGRSGLCRSGGHTCHYEYGVLICDGFKWTIEGKLPKYPCDTCEHMKQGCCDYPTTADDYCALGSKYKPKVNKADCKYSGHSCNKENIWAVADSLTDQEPCPHVCCRQCEVKLCGARCNGA